MEESDRILAHKAIRDFIQWVGESPTEEIRQYRMGIVLSVLNGTLEPQINEEWDTGEELRRNES